MSFVAELKSSWHARLLGYALLLAAATYFVYLLYANSSAVFAQLQSIALRSWIYSLCLGTAGVACFAIGWMQIAKAQQITLGSMQDFRAWCLTLPAKYLPGKIWSGVHRMSMYHSAGHQPVPVTKAYVMEQAISIVAAFAAIGIAFLLQSNAHQAQLMTALAAVVVVLQMVGTLLAGKLGGEKHRRVYWLLSFIGMLLGYLLFGFALAVILSTNHPGNLFKPALSTLALVSGGLSGILAFVAPAGLGAREAATAAVLHSSLGPAQAAFAAVVARIVLMLSELILFLFALLLKPRKAALSPTTEETA